MKPAAFLFDLDGTLIDTEHLWTQAIVDFLRDRGAGAEATVEKVGAMVFGHSWIDIQAMLHRVFKVLKPATPEEDAVHLRGYYDRLAVDPQSQVIPSAVAFFRKAAAIAPCVIVSGSPHRDVVAATKICGIVPITKFVLGAEEYGRGKPAPDGYLHAAEMLDVDASECVVVEDSTAGVAAGRAAGMHVLGVDRNAALHQDFSGCEWLVHDLSEIDVKAVFGE